MNRARTLALVVLMLSYGAVGARQPAVRTSAALGVPVARLAETLGITDPDRSHIVLDVVRIAFDAPDGQDAADTAIKARLQALFRSRIRSPATPFRCRSIRRCGVTRSCGDRWPTTS